MNLHKNSRTDSTARPLRCQTKSRCQTEICTEQQASSIGNIKRTEERTIRMKPTHCLLLAAALFLPASAAVAQMSLGSAVGLSLKADPKVQAANAEVVRARAALSEAKDAFVPVVGAQAGIGKSSGVPLGLPVIFSIQAQSLVFNFSQGDYIRSAHLGWNASELALRQAELDAAEDVVTTYIALDNAEQRRVAAQDAINHATRLLAIAQQRFAAGTDPHIAIPRADLQLAQIQQQQTHIDGEIAELSDHLERLTGLPPGSFRRAHPAIPALPTTETITAATDASLPAGVQAAFVTAQAKYEQARGDQHYLYRPQLSFAAGYSRITTDFSNYDVYYPGFDPARHPDISYNALSIGIQIQLPLFDQAHRAKARESAAEADKARFDAESAKATFLEGRLKLQRSATDLDYNTRIAQDQVEMGQDDLAATLVQLNSTAEPAPGQQALTPEDEQKARIGIAQKRLDLLDAQLLLAQDKISLMRQNGTLSGWINGVTIAR
jgi:outer membrane protein TolC